MKSYLYTLIAAAAATGLAVGATAYTTPVGYVTETIDPGFNFISPTVHNSVVAAGVLDAVTTNTAQDSSADFVAALGTSGASGTYILEIGDANGTIQEVTTWTVDTLDVADLSGVSAPISYKIRKADTLASIFGANNESGLASGTFSPAGADQIWLFTGAGWDKFYFDNFAPPTFTSPGWVNLSTSSAVDPTTINLVYADGFAISSASGNDLVITGEVKTSVTELTLNAGFNFVGAVVPVDVTLASAFGAANEVGLSAGTFSPAGADQVWVFNGLGWDKFYYDNFAPPTFTAPGWVNLTTSSAVDATSVSLPSGYAVNAASAKSVTQGVPSLFNDL